MDDQNMSREQGFYYVIPAVLAEKNKPRKALLYGLISSLVSEKGHCWATNEYLAKKLSMKSISQISNYLNSLEKEGWIRMEIDKKAGNSRKIFLVTPIMEKHKRSDEKSEEGSDEKSEESIISNSTIKEYIEGVFNCWNCSGGIKHRNVNRFERIITAALKIYSYPEIKQAIENYGYILKSEDHWWSYKWTLEQFLTRKSGVDRFLPENFNKDDYLKNPPVDTKAELNGLKKIDELIERELGAVAGEDRITVVLKSIEERYWYRVKRFLEIRYRFDIDGPTIWAAAERKVREEQGANLNKISGLVEEVCSSS